MAVVLPTEPVHYDDAAALFRRYRSEGETVYRLIDCLIAAVTTCIDVPVLHRDRVFDVLTCYIEIQTLSNATNSCAVSAIPTFRHPSAQVEKALVSIITQHPH